ncbi:MAG TPA: hypothetical protein DCP28_35990 [Cytophagales bacterium]|nr:hypothetical protein [Cytophagales bacterium]
MKKLIVAAFALGAFAFASQSNTSLSMNDLKAEAVGCCKPKANADCRSGATGNIYTGYGAFECFEVALN